MAAILVTAQRAHGAAALLKAASPVEGPEVLRLVGLSGAAAVLALGAALTFVVVLLGRLRDAERRHECDRRGALEAQRISNLAQQVAGIGYWRWDARSGLSTWSDQMCAIHGLPRDYPQTALSQAFDRYDPASQARLREIVATGAAAGEQFTLKAGLTRADDGGQRVVLFRGEVEHDAAGKTVALIGVMRDITEDETAKVRIEQSEARYRLLTEAARDVVLSLDPANTIVYVSPSVRRYGWCPEALTGQSGLSLVHEDDQAHLLAMVAELITGAAAEGGDRGFRIRTADGGFAWVEASTTIVRDEEGTVCAVVSQLRDITERREAAQALAESEARYRAIADNVTDVISRASVDGSLTYLSPSVTEVIGHEAKDLIGASLLVHIHPDDQDEVKRAHVEILAGSRPLSAPIIYRVRHKAGHWISVESSPALIHAASGEPVEFIGVTRDVSARVQLMAELRAAAEAAEAATAVKSDFMANMSHEIRTPLNAIVGFTEILKRRTDLDDDAKTQLRHVGHAGEALLAIVNDVLDFSRLEAGQFESKPEPASPLSLLEDAVAMLAVQADAKGLDLALRLDHPLPDGLLIDQSRVRQILLNLLGNALKFTERGGVIVTARFDPAASRFSVDVTDTGSGLSEAQQAKLFQRFSQVDASQTRRHGGTGLGLAICKGLIEAMGGEIGVRSRLGDGATFHFDIPAPVVDLPTPSPVGEAQASGLEGVRVLVVDDNATNRDLARAVLTPFGLDITEAGDGFAAVDAVRDAAFDVILMDIRMPGLDGPAAAQRIRDLEGPDRRTPIIAFSADLDMTGLDGALFQGFVRKPLSAIDLLTSLAQCLDDRDAVD